MQLSSSSSMETKELYTENYNNTDETNQTWHKQMQRYSIFLGRKNQYCENDYTTKCNLEIPCDPYQITNDIFHRTRTKKFTIHVEILKSPNSQNSWEWGRRNQSPWLQIILQSYSHQESMVKWSEVTQPCLTLSDPMDCSPPGSSVHGIFHARDWSWVPFPSL